MPTEAKKRENIVKHLTAAEISAREDAESAVIPEREKLALKWPKFVTHDQVAQRYWKQILKRMDGLDILDDLDSEMLGLYCSMLSRYERLDGLSSSLEDAFSEDATPEQVIELAQAIAGLEGKRQALEKILLTYAEKLGLTPSGRARLAAKRAAEAQEADPNDDLFG